MNRKSIFYQSQKGKIMANICEYRVIVKGKKNACYAFLGSMSAYDEKVVDEEYGTDDNFTLRFNGSCKWSVDCYCKPWTGETPVELPEDAEEALQVGEDKYWYKTVQDRSKMFNVEVMCNSADIDMPMGDYYEHYINGEPVYDDCPDEISGIGDSYLEEGCRCCAACGGEFPEEEMIEHDEDIWFCQDCYNEIF